MAQLSKASNPDPKSIVGEYENFLYGPPEKNHYHYVSIIAVDDGSYIWRALGPAWTLTPISGQKLHFEVGSDCPYVKDGYTTMHFKTDHKGNIVGAFGPGNEFFTKVEQHSSIKYNLKGVKAPNEEQKEGSGTATAGCEGAMARDAIPRAMSMSSFSWKGGKPKRSQCVGRVNIEENFVVSFGLVIHGKVAQWGSILHVGTTDKDRSPAFFVHPNTSRLHVRLSDVSDLNSGYDPKTPCEIGTKYSIRLQSINNEVSLFVDDKLLSFQADVVHICRYKSPVFVGDPWYAGADATVTDLKIECPK